MESKTDKLSKASQNNCTNFIRRFNHLIDLFRGHIDEEAMRDVRLKWAQANQVCSVDEILSYVKDYFLHFLPYVEKNDVDTMLSFDYSQLIVDNCNPKTRELILVISDGIKNTYLSADDLLKKNIEKTVKDLVSCCVIYDKINKKLKSL